MKRTFTWSSRHHSLRSKDNNKNLWHKTNQVNKGFLDLRTWALLRTRVSLQVKSQLPRIVEIYQPTYLHSFQIKKREAIWLMNFPQTVILRASLYLKQTKKTLLIFCVLTKVMQMKTILRKKISLSTRNFMQKTYTNHSKRMFPRLKYKGFLMIKGQPFPHIKTFPKVQMVDKVWYKCLIITKLNHPLRRFHIIDLKEITIKKMRSHFLVRELQPKISLPNICTRTLRADMQNICNKVKIYRIVYYIKAKETNSLTPVLSQ